ncbi:hypothetical protein TIFTF001_025673, partial [Ficus carica]
MRLWILQTALSAHSTVWLMSKLFL